jgi:hypothetical protein
MTVKLEKERSIQKMVEWNEWTKNDILFGFLVPIGAVLLILFFILVLSPFLADVDPSLALQKSLVDGLGETLMISGIPLFAGLLWNQWAGGGAGFLLGCIYALWINDTFVAAGAYAGTVMAGGIAGDQLILGYMLSAMLTGYMAGALNRGSYSFRRMVIVGMIAAWVGGIFLLWTQLMGFQGSPMVTDIPWNLFVIGVPRTLFGVLMPLFATVFGWFGITPRQMV